MVHSLFVHFFRYPIVKICLQLASMQRPNYLCKAFMHTDITRQLLPFADIGLNNSVLL